MLTRLALCLCLALPLPALGQTPTPADLFAEAEAAIAASDRPPGWGLEALIEARARTGDIAGAEAMIALAPETRAPAAWGALLAGTLAGEGPAAALALFDRVPFDAAREPALVDIVRAMGQAGDVAGLEAALASGAVPMLDGLIRSELVGAVLATGDEPRAREILARITDEPPRSQAHRRLARWLASEGRLTEIRDMISDPGLIEARDGIADVLLGALLDEGRRDEAAALLSQMSPEARMTGVRTFARALAETGTAADLADWIAALPAAEDRAGAADAAAAPLVRRGQAGMAQDLLFADNPSPEVADERLLLVVQRLAAVGQAHLAGPIAARITDAPRRDAATALMVIDLAATDLAGARELLAGIATPWPRFDAVLGLMRHDTDPDLLSQALALARADSDLNTRLDRLGQLAIVLADAPL